MKVVLLFVAFLVVSVLVSASTIYYDLPSASFNASNFTSGTGIIVFEVNGSAVISFDTVFGDNRYYPRFANPAGYLVAESDPIFMAENASIWAAITNMSGFWTNDSSNDILPVNSTEAVIIPYTSDGGLGVLLMDSPRDDVPGQSGVIVFNESDAVGFCTGHFGFPPHPCGYPDKATCLANGCRWFSGVNNNPTQLYKDAVGFHINMTGADNWFTDDGHLNIYNGVLGESGRWALSDDQLMWDDGAGSSLYVSTSGFSIGTTSPIVINGVPTWSGTESYIDSSTGLNCTRITDNGLVTSVTCT